MLAQDSRKITPKFILGWKHAIRDCTEIPCSNIVSPISYRNASIRSIKSSNTCFLTSPKVAAPVGNPFLGHRTQRVFAFPLRAEIQLPGAMCLSLPIKTVSVEVDPITASIAP